MAKASVRPAIPKGESDAVAIFWLLYPMLDDDEKLASEAMDALRIVSKYLPKKKVDFMWKFLQKQSTGRAICR